MYSYTTIEKVQGETPLEALARLRARDDIQEEIPLAYAGRLDPMASGKLLVLIGDECKRQTHYHGLDKAYDFEILLGFKSDTGDLLGLAEWFDAPLPTEEVIHTAINAVRGHCALPYPPFSSKTVQGKPLFLWTLEKRLDEIQIPVAKTTLYTLTYGGHTFISAHDLMTTIESRIQKITPVTEASKALGEDFRRVPILARWHALLDAQDTTYTILKMRAVCSSGTYIRSLAPHIASLLGTNGLAYSIHRTHIGRYHPIPLTKTGFWFPSY